MVEFLYTRIVLVFAALGLISMGLAGGMSIFQGNAVAGLLTLLLAVAIGYFWYKDWVRLGKCSKAIERAKAMILRE